MSRAEATADRILRFVDALGRESKGPGRVYLTGGASALLIGWRHSTVDIDLRLDPEPPGAFEAIARLKERLDVNVELASPQDFIPEVPGWRKRSVFIQRSGKVDVFHYDFYAQALSKLQRGHTRDLSDVEAMVQRGLVSRIEVLTFFGAIESALVRFPSINPAGFRARVEAFCCTGEGGGR
jgi:hypothetical protein